MVLVRDRGDVVVHQGEGLVVGVVDGEALAAAVVVGAGRRRLRLRRSRRGGGRRPTRGAGRTTTDEINGRGRWREAGCPAKDITSVFSTSL